MATKKKVTKKTAATKTPAQKNVQPPAAPEVEENHDSDDNNEPESDTEGESSAPAKKNGRIVDVFTKIQTTAEIPGVGKIPVSLIEVEHKGNKQRFRTRREAQLWLRAQRKEDAKAAKEAKDLARMQRELERADKVAGFIGERLTVLANNISTLASAASVPDEQTEKLLQAVALISEVVDTRKKEEAGETSQDDSETK